MPVEPSAPVLLAVSRDRLGDFLTDLLSFERFHFSEESQDFIDFALAQRLDELYSRLLTITERLHVKRDVGVIDSFREGYGEGKRRRLEAEDLAGLISRLEEEVQETTGEISRLLEELDQAKKSLESLERAEVAVRSFSRFSFNLEELAKMRRFAAELFVARKSDLAEISRSLEGRAQLYSEPIDERNVLCAAVSSRDNWDFVERALRAFDVSYLRIPEGYPKVPSEAYRRIVEEMEAARRRVEELDGRIRALAAERRSKIAEEMEAAEMLRSQATRMKSYNLKRVAIVKGYVPVGDLERFRERFRGYLVYVGQPDGEGPVLLKNNAYSSNFEPITLSQGVPSTKEVDPTPIISFVFPAFFGMMFGDIGHGIVLMTLGILLRIRGYESLRKWGNMVISFGVGAAAMGVVTGELFGLHIYNMIPGGLAVAGVRFPLLPESQIVSGNLVPLLFEIAIIAGILHLLSGFSLSFYQEARSRGLGPAAREKVPLLALFISGIFWGYAFIYSGYSFSAMLGPYPTPLGVTTGLLSRVTIPIILGSSAAMIAAKAAEVAGGFGAKFMEGFIEWFIQLIEIVSNTISYVRLGVLLMVHMALLYIMDMFLPIGGVVGYSAWFLGNLGIVALEGLMVYIQDIRLHAYEWFTKFFEGAGRPFIPLSMRGKRVELAIRAGT